MEGVETGKQIIRSIYRQEKGLEDSVCQVKCKKKAWRTLFASSNVKQRVKELEMIWRQKTLKLYGPFYGWSSTASRLELLRGGSSLFTIKFPEIPGTHFIDLIRNMACSRLQ